MAFFISSNSCLNSSWPKINATRKYERDRNKSRCRRCHRPNGNGRTVGGKGNAKAAKINPRFAVDVSALLFPSTGSAIPCINANVTGISAVVVVIRRPNGNRRAVGGKGNALAAIITRRFAVDVSALLFPSTGSAIPCVNTNVTGVRAVARRYHSPQWQPSCRRRKGKRYAAIIIRRFAVDVSALLFPSTCSAIPCVNTNVTGSKSRCASLPCAPMATVVPSEERETLSPLNHPPLRRRCQRLAVPKHL